MTHETVTPVRGAAPARRRRPLARLGLLLAAATVAPLLYAVPAAADTRGRVDTAPECSRSGSALNCYRYHSAWVTNHRDGKQIGNRGARHYMELEYVSNRPSSMVRVSGFSEVFDLDRATRDGVERLRLTQTFKALGPGGGAISVGWGGAAIGEEGAVVTNREVRLAMTRAGGGRMERWSDLEFPRGDRAHSVEHVSSSTIEYPSGNRSYRLVSTGRLSNY